MSQGEVPMLDLQSYVHGAMAGRPSSRKPSEFGSRLSSLREGRGLSQIALAELVGMTQQQITYYERRARSPSLDVAQRFASALGVQVTALLPHVDEKRTGRPSEFEQRWHRIKGLPRSTQKDIIEMLDVALERAERRANDVAP